MLAFSGQHFAQILEGAEAAIGSLIASITADARHFDLQVVYAEPTTKREYGAWTMGYVEGFGASEHVERLLYRDPVAQAGAREFARRLFSEPRL